MEPASHSPDAMQQPDCSICTSMTLHQEENRLLISADELIYQSRPVEMSRYQWANNRRFLLSHRTGKPAHGTVSLQAPHYVYDTQSKLMIALADGSAALRNVYLSPGGKHVAYDMFSKITCMSSIWPTGTLPRCNH